jgi:hypothetical protein
VVDHPVQNELKQELRIRVIPVGLDMGLQGAGKHLCIKQTRMLIVKGGAILPAGQPPKRKKINMMVTTLARRMIKKTGIKGAGVGVDGQSV